MLVNPLCRWAHGLEESSHTSSWSCFVVMAGVFILTRKPAGDDTLWLAAPLPPPTVMTVAGWPLCGFVDLGLPVANGLELTCLALLIMLMPVHEVSPAHAKSR